MDLSRKNKIFLIISIIILVISIVVTLRINNFDSSYFTNVQTEVREVTTWLDSSKSYVKGKVYKKTYSGVIQSVFYPKDSQDFALVVLSGFNGGDQKVSSSTQVLIPDKFEANNLYTVNKTTGNQTLVSLNDLLNRFTFNAAVYIEISIPEDLSQPSYVSNLTITI